MDRAMKIIRKQVLMVMVVAFCLLSAVFGAEGRRDVLVGYYYDSAYMNKDRGGSYGGYDVEYLYALSSYAGWNLHFVDYPGIQDCLDAAERGDIDIVTNIAKTPLRESAFLFSRKQMNISYVYILAGAMQEGKESKDPAVVSNMRIGVRKGSIMESLYTDWCATYGFSPLLVRYESLEECRKALDAGEVDGILSGVPVSGTRKVVELPSVDSYFIVNKNRSDIMQELDDAMSSLYIEDPSFSWRLYQKYFSTQLVGPPVFSDEEKTYLHDCSALNVGVLKREAPYSIVGTDGKQGGLLLPFFNHLSDLCGVSFVFVPFDTDHELKDALKDGRIDIIGMVGNNVFEAHDADYVVTHPYYADKLVVVMRMGLKSPEKVSVQPLNEHAADAYIASSGLSLEKLFCNNVSEGFDALDEHKTDLLVCDVTSAIWNINKRRATRFVVTTLNNGEYDLSMAVRPEDTRLRSILNIMFSSSPSYFSELANGYAVSDASEIRNVLERVPLRWISIFVVLVVILLALVVLAMVIIIRKRKMDRILAVRQRETEQKEMILAGREKADEEKHAFFSTISHDMRTPLTAIIGFSSLALQEKDPEKITDYLTKIQNSGNLLLDLINDTLSISKMEQGKMDLHNEAVDLMVLRDSIVVPIKEAALKKHIIFTASFPETPAIVYADRLSLQKILLSLLSNSIRFTPEGGHVSLLLDWRTVNPTTKACTMIVKDDGIGMSEEFLKRAFEPFAQERRPGYESNGAGLGLSIVKRLVTLMGGSIEAESRLDKGSQFTIRMQFTIVPDASRKTPVATEMDTSFLRGKQVLLCEDNLLNKEIVQQLLSKVGMTMLWAKDGKEGVDMFSINGTEFFSIILMDIRMPVMDGYSAARTIRTLDRKDAKTIPIIALTADAYDDEVRRCLEAGMNGYVAKPIDPKKFFSMLLMCINKN